MLSLLALSVIASGPAQEPPAPIPPPVLHRQSPTPMRPFDKYPWNRPYPVAKHWLLSERK